MGEERQHWGRRLTLLYLEMSHTIPLAESHFQRSKTFEMLPEMEHQTCSLKVTHSFHVAWYCIGHPSTPSGREEVCDMDEDGSSSPSPRDRLIKPEGLWRGRPLGRRHGGRRECYLKCQEECHLVISRGRRIRRHLGQAFPVPGAGVLPRSNHVPSRAWDKLVGGNKGRPRRRSSRQQRRWAVRAECLVAKDLNRGRHVCAAERQEI